MGAGDKGGGDLTPLLKLLEGEGRSPLQTLVDTIHTNPNLNLVLAWQESGRPPVVAAP